MHTHTHAHTKTHTHSHINMCTRNVLAHIHTQTGTYAHTFTNTHRSAQTCTHQTFADTCTYIHAYIHHTLLHRPPHIHTHIHVHICMHTCTLNMDGILELEDCGKVLQNPALLEVCGNRGSLALSSTLFLLSLIDRSQSDPGDGFCACF